MFGTIFSSDRGPRTDYRLTLLFLISFNLTNSLRSGTKEMSAASLYFRPRKLRCISFRLFRSVVVQAPSLCHPFFSCRGKRSTRSKKGKGKWREASLFCVSTLVCACILTGFGGVARPGVGQAERYPSPREWPGVWDHLFVGQGS